MSFMTVEAEEISMLKPSPSEKPNLLDPTVTLSPDASMPLTVAEELS